MFRVRTEVLEGARRAVLWANINGRGGCATGRWGPSCLFPRHGTLFVEKAGGRQGVRPEGSCCFFLLQAPRLSSTPRAVEVGRRKRTNGCKLKIKDDLHPRLVGM